MKDIWYSDNRDLVKWGILLQLAQAHDAATILQVAYYRPTSWDGKYLDIDGRLCPLPSAVLDHFPRRISNIVTLRSKAKVNVLDAHLGEGDRPGYLRQVLARIGGLARPAIVFLDPDTGLEPQGNARPEHVREDELRAIWDALRHDDLLVFYQHRMRSRSWLADKHAQFENALGLESGGSKVARGKAIAPDVAFFYCRK